MRGRKRKPGQRTACGRLARHETEKEAMATVIAARRRHYGVSAREARDPRLGTALGRLNYQGRISDAQYQAGLTFGELYQRHHRTMGLPTPSPRSVAGLLINEGIFGGSDYVPHPTTSRGCAGGSRTRWQRSMRAIGSIGCRWAGGRLC